MNFSRGIEPLQRRKRKFKKSAAPELRPDFSVFNEIFLPSNDFLFFFLYNRRTFKETFIGNIRRRGRDGPKNFQLRKPIRHEKSF